MLLQREVVNPNHADTCNGQTPLLRVVRSGHEGVVKILLEREDVNPSQADTGYNQTPLLWAAEGGHEGVVKLLLERKDVRIASPDNQHQTPLSLALSKGQTSIVRILERHNANSGAVGRSSQTSLPP